MTAHRIREPHAVGSRPRRLIRALGALAVLVAIVGGTPVLLLSLHTIPGAAPSVHQITHTLTSRDDGTLALKVFAAVAWICWALFTLSLATELLSRAVFRRSVHLPGLGGFQRPAAALLTVITVAFTVLPVLAGGAPAHAATPRQTVAVTRTTAATATTSAFAALTTGTTTGDHQDTRAPISRSVARPAATTTLPTYTVRPRDELWGLAETHLGNPLRYTEILDLNRAVIPATDELLPGTVLLMPADAQHLPGQPATTNGTPSASAETTVTVKPGDTLAGIEQHVTGEPDWTAGWQDNQDRAEPGGAYYDNPDLLRPGWTLEIPAASARVAAHPEPSPHGFTPDPALAVAVAGTDSPDAAPPAVSVVPPVPAQDAASPAATTPPPPAQNAPPSVATSTAPTAGPAETAGATPVTPAPATGGPSRATLNAGSRGHRQNGTSEMLLAFAGGGGLILAGLALQAAARYRRAQFRERRPGRALAASSPQDVQVERSLINADPDSRIDVTWYRDAMTGLTHALRDTPPDRFPDVIAARVSSAGLELVLLNDAGTPPTPWTLDSTGRRWSLEVTAARLEHPLEEGTTAFPLLVSLGYSPTGDQWLLDLERAGTVAITGDTQRSADLARFIAAEVAHSGWSLDTVHVYLAGVGGELPAIDPGRLHYSPDYTGGGDAAGNPGPLESITSRTEDHLRSMEIHGLDVFDARVRNRQRETYDPTLLVLAPRQGLNDPAIPALLEKLNSSGRRTSTAVICTDDRPGLAFTISLDADATLHVPQLGLTLHAQQLPADEAASFTTYLLDLKSGEDRSAPLPDSDRPWDRHMDVLGALAPWTQVVGRDGPQPSRPAVPARYLHVAGTPAPVAEPQVNSILPFATSTYLQTTAATENDLELLAPIVTDTLTEMVEHADRGLDADLAAWHDPACPTPRLTLLGPVEVRAHGRPPAKRIAFHTEVVAYFATRTGVITIERFADDFWPHDPDILTKSTPRTAISNCRLWLGADYLPEATDFGYRINGILIDAELFRRLRARGAARGSNGITDLQEALELVTGPPMSHGSRIRAYLWLAANRLDNDYRAMVVDVAHTLATHYLAVGDPDRAYDAAKVAELAGSTEDTPLIDLVYACDAQGRYAESEATVQRLLLNYSVDIEEDLPKRTADLLLRREKYRRPQ